MPCLWRSRRWMAVPTSRRGISAYMEGPAAGYVDFARAELSEGVPALFQSGVGIESHIVECVE